MHDSRIYCRFGCSTPKYFYDAVQVNITTIDRYNIASQCLIDTYGYIYENSFNASKAWLNLLAQDDENEGNGQFKINVDIRTPGNFIVSVTTYSINIT